MASGAKRQELKKQRRLRRFRLARPTEGFAAEQKAQAKSVRTPKKKRRLTIRGLIVRSMIYGALGFVVLILMTLSFISTFVKGEDVKGYLTSLVESQSGGRLIIGDVRFDVMTGIRLNDVSFYPPKRGNLIGYAMGGAVEEEAMLTVRTANLKYSLPRLLLAKFHLNAANLQVPEVHLRSYDGHWNFDSILEYRRQKFGEADSQLDADPVSSALQLSTDYVVIPFEILAKDIGIDNLTLDVLAFEGGELRQLLATSGLSLNAGMSWFGAKGKLWCTIAADGDNRLTVDSREWNTQSRSLEQVLFISTELRTRGELINLTDAKLSLNISDLQLAMRDKTLPRQSASLIGHAKLQSDLQGLTISNFTAELGSIAMLTGAGFLKRSSMTEGSLAIKLESQASLDADQLNPLLKSIVPGLDVGGKVTMTGLRAEGEINPESLQADPLLAVLPYVKTTILVDGGRVSYAPLALETYGNTGRLTMSAGPSGDATGSFLEIDLDIESAMTSAEADLEGKRYATTIIDFREATKLRLVTPDLSVPLYRVNVSAAQVAVKGHKIPETKVPFVFEASGDGVLSTRDLATDVSLSLPTIADATVDINCRDGCTDLQADIRAKVPSLATLHALAAPFATIMNLESIFPVSLRGTLDVDLTANAKFVKDPSSGLSLEEMQQGLELKGQSSLQNVYAEIPHMRVGVEDLDIRVFASGKGSEQRIDLSCGVQRLSATPPTAKHPFRIERMNLDLIVENTLSKTLDLDSPLLGTSTKVSNRFFVAKAESEDYFPQALRELSIEVQASQEGGRKVEIERIVARAPQYGIVSRTKASARITEAMLPESFAVESEIEVEHNGEEKLPLGIVSRGYAGIELRAQSDDLTEATINGEATFKSFDLKLPGKDGADDVFSLRGMAGRLPFEQVVPLQAFLAPQGVSEQRMDAAMKLAEAVGYVDPSALVQEELAGYLEKQARRNKSGANVAVEVDYTTVKTFFPGKSPLSIEALEAAGLSLEKLEFDVELKRRSLAVNQFLVNFLGGRLQGFFNIDFAQDPGALASNSKMELGQLITRLISRIKTAVHLTRLDTTKLLDRFPDLKEKGTSWSLVSDPFLDGAVHLDFDVAANDLQGGIEFTSIGKEQLRMMLFYVDPQEKNQAINDIRSALRWGDVKVVSIPIKNGEIGMDVDVRLLAAPIPTPKVSRVPVSKIIGNFLNTKKTPSKPVKEATSDESA